MMDRDSGQLNRPRQDWSDLAPRIVSALVLVGCALVSAYFGGWIFVLLWTLAASVVMQEWLRLTASERGLVRTIPQVAGLVLIGVLAGFGHWRLALSVLPAMLVLSVILATAPRRIWDAAGVVYATALLMSAIAARQSPDLGLVAIVWLFMIVWATDVFAYFVGKTLGGPKLWPRVSPKKTWSGIVGGAAGGVVAGQATLLLAQLPVSFASVAAALVIAVSSEAGDLFESFMKRHFGVKDTGNIIPGHGGLMDRLDGFIVASACAVILGLLRSPDDIARGMLAW